MAEVRVGEQGYRVHLSCDNLNSGPRVGNCINLICNLVYVAAVKITTKSNLERKVYILSYSSQFIMKRSQGRTPGGRNCSRGHRGGTMLSAVLPMADSA